MSTSRHALVFATLAFAGCSGDAATDAGPSGPDASIFEEDLQFCVDETNRYRAMVDLPPLSRAADIEAFAAIGAQIDGEAHSAHKHFIDTNGGNGIAYAENEIPWWDLSAYGTVHAVIEIGLALMWDEGPSGPDPDNHYDNITGPYTEVGCGIYISDLGEITVTQDLR